MEDSFMEYYGNVISSPGIKEYNLLKKPQNNIISEKIVVNCQTASIIKPNAEKPIVANNSKARINRMSKEEQEKFMLNNIITNKTFSPIKKNKENKKAKKIVKDDKHISEFERQLKELPDFKKEDYYAKDAPKKSLTTIQTRNADIKSDNSKNFNFFSTNKVIENIKDTKKSLDIKSSINTSEKTNQFKQTSNKNLYLNIPVSVKPVETIVLDQTLDNKSKIKKPNNAKQTNNNKSTNTIEKRSNNISPIMTTKNPSNINDLLLAPNKDKLDYIACKKHEDVKFKKFKEKLLTKIKSQMINDNYKIFTKMRKGFERLSHSANINKFNDFIFDNDEKCQNAKVYLLSYYMSLFHVLHQNLKLDDISITELSYAETLMEEVEAFQKEKSILKKSFTVSKDFLGKKRQSRRISSKIVVKQEFQP